MIIINSSEKWLKNYEIIGLGNLIKVRELSYFTVMNVRSSITEQRIDDDISFNIDFINSD